MTNKFERYKVFHHLRVDAIQWWPGADLELPSECNITWPHPREQDKGYFSCPNMGGPIAPGDFIVRDEEGKYDVYDALHFALTYMKVEHD